jgi:hypothetical protein
LWRESGGWVPHFRASPKGKSSRGADACRETQAWRLHSRQACAGPYPTLTSYATPFPPCSGREDYLLSAELLNLINK